MSGSGAFLVFGKRVGDDEAIRALDKTDLNGGIIHVEKSESSWLGTLKPYLLFYPSHPI